MSQTASASTNTDQDGAGSLRVMLVDDSVVIRGLLSRWLTETPGIEVVSTQRTGLGAIKDLEKSNPDVVVLDIEMPEMDGLTALPKLLEIKRDLVVIVASTLTQRNAEMSLRALSLGAKDYVPKPEGNHGITTSIDFRRELIEKIKALGGALRKRKGTPVRAFRAEQAAGASKQASATASRLSLANINLRPFSRIAPRILAIGSSTGGPQALQEVFKAIAPAIGRIPVVLTQHMPATFTAILADHIGKASGRPTGEAKDGAPLTAGNVYVAPGGKHMIIESKDGKPSIRLTDDPPINFCKPAVDPMFESVSKLYGAAVLSVVLTGMGSDGAKGAKIIADGGGTVIAQDETTSVVWGMPGATAAIGACSAVLPLNEIGPKINFLLGASR